MGRTAPTGVTSSKGRSVEPDPSLAPAPSRIGFEDPDDYARARDLLVAAGYTDDALRKKVGVAADSLPDRAGAFLALEGAEEGSPLGTIILLFIHGAPVDLNVARQALQPISLERWSAAGLVLPDGNRLHPTVRLVPIRGRWLAYDRPEHKSNPDFVMGVGTSSTTLIDIAVRRPAEAMLDLGCGCGTQGLFAAGYARQVVASDANVRAIQFTRFNIAINGLQNVDTALGDLFEPVAGRKFDLVLSNPPFVISPESRYTYRDSGLPGDRFCERLVREVPAVLSEGGFCQLLCNWAHYRGEDWRERLASWFEGTGCDTWVMRTETRNPAVYAYTWLRQTESEDPIVLSRFHRRWMEYYAREGIEQISTGFVMMRRTTGRPGWCRIDENPPAILGPCGDDIELAFAVRDFLESTKTDSDLLQARLRVSPVAQLRQHMSPSEGAWEVTEMELRRDQGLGTAARVDAYVAGLVGRCDGRRTLRELIDELARAVGRSPEDVASAMLPIVRGLIERAIMLPEGVFG